MKAIFYAIRKAVTGLIFISGEELTAMAVNLLEKVMMALCFLGTLICVIAGFFKPHCFIMAPVFAFMALMVWSNIKEREDELTNERAGKSHS